MWEVPRGELQQMHLEPAVDARLQLNPLSALPASPPLSTAPPRAPQFTDTPLVQSMPRAKEVMKGTHGRLLKVEQVGGRGWRPITAHPKLSVLA